MPYSDPKDPRSVAYNRMNCARWRARLSPEEKEKQKQYMREYRMKNRLKIRELNKNYVAVNKKKLRWRMENSPPAPNIPETYSCKKCKETKPFTLEFFQKKPTNKWKLDYTCRVCTSLVSQKSVTKRKYGISYEEAVALRNTSCEICGSTKSLHIDHCHTTGKVRGPLCRGCNHALGNMKDSPERLRAAADYLEKYLDG